MGSKREVTFQDFAFTGRKFPDEGYLIDGTQVRKVGIERFCWDGVYEVRDSVSTRCVSADMIYVTQDKARAALLAYFKTEAKSLLKQIQERKTALAKIRQQIKEVKAV